MNGEIYDRYGLETRTLLGENASVNEKTIEQWKENLWSLVKGYKVNDIFNCDKNGLFFKIMHLKILALKGNYVKEEKTVKKD